MHAIPHPSFPICLFGFKYNLIRLHKRWRWIIPPLRRFSTCIGKKPSALAEDKLQIFRKLLGVLTCFLQLLHILQITHLPWRLWFPKEVGWPLLLQLLRCRHWLSLWLRKHVLHNHNKLSMKLVILKILRILYNQNFKNRVCAFKKVFNFISFRSYLILLLLRHTPSHIENIEIHPNNEVKNMFII